MARRSSRNGEAGTGLLRPERAHRTDAAPCRGSAPNGRIGERAVTCHGGWGRGCSQNSHKADRGYDVSAETPCARFHKPLAGNTLALPTVRALHLIGTGQDGEQGLPGGKPPWLPAGRAALDRVLGVQSCLGRGGDFRLFSPANPNRLLTR